ncbi:hypothetical protein RJT34_07436 [Clitoria ternatea]|uniref:Uncharacterized protein n=1 Tax=Clitoria ternatea TaxID=43366 RepID=A0AAN9K553_CLITE
MASYKGRSRSRSRRACASYALVKPTGENLDIGWRWNSLKNINDRKSVTCDFCLKTTTGGITRAKRHQMGIRGDVSACENTPREIKKLLIEKFLKKKANSTQGLKENDDLEEEEVHEISNIKAGKRPASSHFNTVTDAYDVEARARTIQYIAQFLHKNSIPFDVVRSKSFKLMVEAIANNGSHLKPPISFHEMRVSLPEKELKPKKGKNKILEKEQVICTRKTKRARKGVASSSSGKGKRVVQSEEEEPQDEVETEDEEEHISKSSNGGSDDEGDYLSDTESNSN